LHPKAIYIVEGTLYQVERFDFDGRKAYVRQIDCDYYTTAITYTKVTPIDEFAGDGGDRAGAATAPGPGDGRVRTHGEVHVVSRVVGFKKIKFYTNENVGSGELDLPEQQMHTTSYWLTIPARVLALLPYASDDRRDGVVGLAFALKQVAQLLLMCDGHDIGISISGFGVQDSGFAAAVAQTDRASEIPHPDGVQVFVYDNYPGGIGFSKPLFDMHPELLAGTRTLVAECPCENGCPGCVGPVGNTGPLAKLAALRILDLMLAHTEGTGVADDTEPAEQIAPEAQAF
jgi:DEAD/DEAH box helicase domain-containing protein